MKSFLIVVGLCATLMGCGSADEKQPEPKTYTNDYTPSYSGVGGYHNPCGRTYVLEFPLPDGGVIRKEVPVYCNPYADEYYGDPPDWKANPWDVRTLPELDEYNQERP